MSGLSWDGTGSHTRVFPLDLDGTGTEDAKLTEDRYEVFVNGELIGHKTLLNQNDRLKDIDDFLKKEGYTYFTAQVNGDHYEITADVEGKDIQDALKVYLNNR